MNTEEFKAKSKEVGFEEFHVMLTEHAIQLYQIVEYNEADNELKIYLTKLIICRAFPPTRNYRIHEVDWWIENFLATYEKDPLKVWMAPTIKEAMKMVLSKDIFVHNVIATTFMFGIVEFYVKHKLGYRPEQFDFFDDKAHEKFRRMSIGYAINNLKATDTAIARSIIQIDNYNEEVLTVNGIKKERWVAATISERLWRVRNMMLHGSNHSDYSMGKYLAMLYILLYLHDV